eukprot:s1629_g15.t1
MTLEFAGFSQQIAFTTTQTVGNLLKAEAALSGSAVQHVLKCEGVTLPSFAFLQERTYQLEPASEGVPYPVDHVPVFLLFLREMKLIWVPASMTYGTLLTWAGIHEPCDPLDEFSNRISVTSDVEAWKQIIVQQHPDEVALDLDLFALGFGHVDDSLSIGSLHTSSSWVGTGLWHFDQVVRSNLLMSWVGSGYHTVTVWLPSFAAAVLEFWPSTIDDKLASWFRSSDVRIFALVYEDWGWILAKLSVTHGTFQVTYFEAPGHVAAHMAYRAFCVSNRKTFIEVCSDRCVAQPNHGTLNSVLHVLDDELGIPACLIHALHGLELSQGMASSGEQLTVSPTLPWSVGDEGLPHPQIQAGLSLSVRAWPVGTITCSDKPLMAVLLLDQHWVMMRCERVGACLRVCVYDGLVGAPSPQLRFLCSQLQQLWGVSQICVEHKWILPQQFDNTCGTILPAKGVPPEEVPNRAQAAIKVFGRAQVQKALQASNAWAALKQLGNSRTKPFMWVSHDELQAHIKDSATAKFGARLDIKRSNKHKEPKRVPAPHQIDPANLTLPPRFFVTNCGTPLSQLTLSGVVKNACGIAFATASDAMQYATEGKLIPPEGLALLIVGNMPEAMPKPLPMHRSVGQEGAWEELVRHPIRSLLGAFPTLRLCKDSHCHGMCSLFHASIEKDGIESGLLDVWGYKWAHLDGAKSSPDKSNVLSVYLRVPESDFDLLHDQAAHIDCNSSNKAAHLGAVLSDNGAADPGHNGADPWSGYSSTSKPAASSGAGPSQHVQQKIDEVEQKLQDHVQTTLAFHMEQADQASSTRMQTVENQIQSLVENQQKMQLLWIQDGPSKIQDLRQDFSHLSNALQTCSVQSQENTTAIAGVVNDLGICNHNILQQGQALQGVAQDLSGLKENLNQTLESYFDRQAEKIESLLSKRQQRD